MKTVGQVQGREDMIGVTLGLRAFRGRAEMAARQFVWATGLPAVIIEDSDLGHIAGLITKHCNESVTWAEFPFAAKLFLFDLLPNERIVYFDADVLYVNRWDPIALDPHCFHAVRDMWWNVGVAADHANWGLPLGHYFNSGFFVINRQLHLEWLRNAARSWGASPSIMWDQAPLNSSAFRLNIRTQWLHRDYNMLDGLNTCEAGSFAVKALHVGGACSECDCAAAIAQYQDEGTRCLPTSESHAEGTWLYELGDTQRELEFWEDGMIGRGGAHCERFWRVWLEHGQPTLAVFGNGGGERKITETFRATRCGDHWKGRWNRFEQHEVTLRPISR